MIRTILVILLFVALGVAVMWPVWSDPFNVSLVGKGENDTQFLLWATFWGYHALTSNPASLHSANIFYPEPYTYLYSEMPLANSLLAAPWIAIFYHPEFTLNVLILSIIVLGGLGMFLLARDLVGRSDAALFAAVVFMFNPAHFGRLMQLHLFGDHWLPWFIWALLRWLRGNRKKGEEEAGSPLQWQWAALATLFYILNVLSGAHIAVFGTLIGVVVGLFYMMSEGLHRQRRFWIGLAAMSLAALLVLGPVFYPYLIIGENMRSHRVDSSYALQVGSAGAYELLSANTRMYNWLDATSGWPGDLFNNKLRGYLFIGVVPLLVACIGFLRQKREIPIQTTGFRMKIARGLDIALILIAWMAIISAIFGNTSFLFFFLRFPAPPSYILLLTGLLVAALRFLIFPQYEHYAFTAGRWLLHSVHIQRDHWPWLILVAIGILLSLGPTGLLYLIISKLPLLGMIRVPRRFILIVAFALSVLCAYGFSRLIQARRGWRKLVVIGAIFLLFSIEALPEPVRTYPVEKLHPAYLWLGKQEGQFTVMEFPAEPRAYAAFVRQVYGSIFHWKDLIVGYSGFQSDENIQLISELGETFPSDRCVSLLDNLGVRYVIVIADLLSDETKDKLASQDRLQYELSLGGADIYKLISGKTR